MNRSRRQRIGLRERGQHRIQTVTISVAVGGAAASLVFGAILAAGTAQADPAAQSPPPPDVQAPSAGPGTGSSVGQPLDPSVTTPDAGGTEAPDGNLIPPAAAPRPSHSSHSDSASSSSGSSGSSSHVHVRSGGS